MCDHDYGHAAGLEFTDDAHESGPSARIEHGRGLIEHEHARLHGERTRDGNALFLPARERMRLMPLEAHEPHGLERCAHALGDLRGRDTHVLGAESDIVLDERRHELVIGILEHHAHMRAHGVDERGARRVEAVDGHAALIRHEQGVEVPSKRRLARPVTAEHGQDLAVTDRQAHMGQRIALAIVGVADILDVDHVTCGP